MRNFLIFCSFWFLISCGDSIKKKEYISPEKLYPEVFKEALKSDLKMDEFLDATALLKPDEINRKFKKLKSEKEFNFINFFKQNFRINTYSDIYTQNIKTEKDLINYSENALASLKRFPKDDSSSLIPTRKEYYSGGSFHEEFNYFNSYILMLAFLENNKLQEAENLLLNAAQFVQDYGYIPIGNRSYLLDRSNPPVFALLVTEMARHKPEVLPQYASLLTKEYQYWMASQSKEESQILGSLKGSKTYAYKKAVLMHDKNLLNRYFVSSPGISKDQDPTSIAGSQSLITAEESNDTEGFRWKSNQKTISPQHFLAVDLNALLYFMEKTLSLAYAAKGNPDYAESFFKLAEKRKMAFNKYFWNEEKGFFADYNFKKQRKSEVCSTAGLWPVLLGLANENQTRKAIAFSEKYLMKEIGLVDYYTDEAKSYSFSAKSQLIGYLTVKKAGNEVLAEKIRRQWLATNLSYAKKSERIQADYFENTEITKPQKSKRIDGALGVLLYFLNQ